MNGYLAHSRPNSASRGRGIDNDTDRHAIDDDDIMEYAVLETPRGSVRTPRGSSQLPNGQQPPKPRHARHNVIALAKARTASAGKRRNASAGKSRTASAGKARQATPTKNANLPTPTGGGGSGSGRKGWGGFLRRKKPSKQQEQQQAAQKYNGAPNSPVDGVHNHNNTCDYCQKIAWGKTRSEMYQRAGHFYCSTDCTRRHHQEMEAQEEEVDGNIDQGLEALMRQKQQRQKEKQLRGEDDTANNGTNGVNYNRKQFFPSNASPISTSDSIREINHGKDNGSQINNPFASNSVSQSHSNSPTSTQTSIQTDYDYANSNDYKVAVAASATIYSPGGVPATGYVVPKRNVGRGVADEYRDYNDELSRQLRLAARQDQLEYQERNYQKRQFINAHRSNPATTGAKDMSPARLGKLGKLNYLSNSPGGRSSLNHSNVNVGESSPGRYARNLRGVGVNGMGTTNAAGGNNFNNDNNKGNPNRRKLPIMKPTETSTQSTESVSTTSSFAGAGGGVGPPQIGRTTGALPAAAKTGLTMDESVTSKTSSKGSWGYLDVSNNSSFNERINAGSIGNSWKVHSKRSNSEAEKAFSGLDGWPENVSATSNTKTPRTRNSRGTFNDGDGKGGGTRKNGNENRAASNPDEEGNATSNISKTFERQVSSLSSRSKSPLLPPISENNNHNERSRHSTIPPPPSSNSGKKKPKVKIAGVSAVHRARLDHSATDIVSEVSYYDDPSVDMMSSLGTLGTYDTLPTNAGGSGGRASPRLSPIMMNSRGAGLTKVASNIDSPTFSNGTSLDTGIQSCDPPGNSIDELLKAGIYGKAAGVFGIGSHLHSLDPSQHDANHGLDPSVTGVDPSGDEEQIQMSLLMMQQEQEQEEFQSPQRQAVQRQQRAKSNTPRANKSPQKRHQHRLQHHDQHPNRTLRYPQQNLNDIQTPPQLHNVATSSRQQAQQWSGQGARKGQLDRQHFDNFEGNGQEEGGGFHLSNIEIPNSDDLLEGQGDGSIGMLTNDEDDEGLEGLQGSKEDDDTATNTLDTVDLVAEVKRVWRHVQRYEKKKIRKKQLKQQYQQKRNISHITGDVGNSLTSVDEAQVAETPMDGNPIFEEENGDTPMMMGLMQQFERLQADGADSKFSDITPSSSHHHRDISQPARGRSMEPNNGRLGQHIRSTSAHSRTHSAVPDSPGLESNEALTSYASTEKDVMFLNEGVDAFYEGQDDQVSNGASATAAQQHSNHYRIPPNDKNVKIQQQKSAPQTSFSLRQYSESASKSHSNEEDPNNLTDFNNLRGNRRPRTKLESLSKPYDMTKVKSAGTSFTQKTEKMSNLTPGPLLNQQPISRFHGELAHKYAQTQQRNSEQWQQQHSQHNTQHHMQENPQENPQQQHGYRSTATTQQQRLPQSQEYQHQQQQSSAGALYAKAIQNARDRRMHNYNHRVS